MSYKEKVISVFNDEKKILYMFFLLMTFMILIAIFFREGGVARYNLVVVMLCLLGFLWLAVRYLVKPVVCNSCNKDVRATIMLLGKESKRGYCPYCGSEIT